VDRAAAVAETVPAGTPRWPPATRWLGGDRVFTRAIDRGRDLIAVSDDELLVVPKDGSRAVRVTAFRDRGVAQLERLDDDLVVLEVYRRDVATATLVAVRLDDGGTDELVDVPQGTKVSARAGRLYWSSWTPQDGARLWSIPSPFARPVMVAQAQRTFEDLVATDTGVVWRDWDGVTGKNAGERIATLEAGAHAPTVAERKGPLAYLTGNGARLVAVAIDEVVAVDPATAATTPLSRPLIDVWELKLGPTAACLVDNGRQIEVHKRAKVLAVPLDGSGDRELATDLDHPHVLAVSATHCYATYAGRGGIAEIPLP
jgi:hypothetical protein